MIAVGPDAPRLDRTSHPVGAVAIAGPDAGPQAVKRVIGNFQRFRVGFKGGHGQHGAKDFLLENAHFIVAFEQGWLDVIAARRRVAALHRATTNQNLGTFFAPDIQIRQDFFKLLL